MNELRIYSISKDSKLLTLSNNVSFIINPKSLKIVENWREGDIVSVKKKDSNNDKFSYTISNGDSTAYAMRN